MTFNQPVSKRSVEDHLFIQIGWQKENRVNVKAEPDEKVKETPVFLPLPGEHIILVTPQQKDESAPPLKKSIFARIFKSIARFFTERSLDDKEKKPGQNSIETRRVWLIAPEKELPEDASISLRVEPGLESALGPEKGIGKRELLAFATFPEFEFNGAVCFDNNDNRITVNNDRDLSNRNLCNPMRSVMLEFSSPVINSERKVKN